MENDQYHKGLANIRAAMDEWFGKHGVTDAVVECTHGAGASEAVFSITAGGKTESQQFLRQEIEDSGEAIDAPAAVKVRMLVSHFVR